MELFGQHREISKLAQAGVRGLDHRIVLALAYANTRLGGKCAKAINPPLQGMESIGKSPDRGLRRYRKVSEAPPGNKTKLFSRLDCLDDTDCGRRNGFRYGKAINLAF